MKHYVQALLRCSLFDGLTERSLFSMLECLQGRKLRYEKGAAIFHQGDTLREIGVVLSGAVQVVQEDYKGNRTILAHVLPGELFGEAFACAEVEALPVSIVAAEESVILLLSCRRITTPCHSACPGHTRLIYNLMHIMAQKNLQLNQKLQITAQRTTREKLLAYLTQQSQLRGQRRFTIPFRRQELADFLHVDRSGLSVEISKLKAEGMIDCYRSTFELL